MTVAAISIKTESLYKLDELREAVKAGTIKSAQTDSGKRVRFFISTDGNLCYFNAGSSRRGPHVNAWDVEHYVKYTGPADKKVLTEEQQLKKKYRILAKYKKMAGLASFTNNFIRDCLAVPEFEVWKNDLVKANDWESESKSWVDKMRPKTLYDYHLTTGTRIDGKVISLDRIAKKYPREIERLRESIKTKTKTALLGGIYNGWQRAKFDGYDITLETNVTDDGDFMAYLSLEFAGCGNGYYYLLINDDNFIGYDID